MSGYDKFSDRFRKSAMLEATPPKPPKLPKLAETPGAVRPNGGEPLGGVHSEATKVGGALGRANPQGGGALGGLGSLGGIPLRADISTPADISAPADVIAPHSLAGHAAAVQPKDEPAYDQSCLARRGRVQRKGGAFLHFCVTCGAWGAFGYGVTGDQHGLWYCLPHRPQPR
jgi:hypothetical protein